MPLNIPVLIRSLGQDMFQIGMDRCKKFRPSLDLIIYLDGNITSHGPDDATINVSEFHNAWWKGHSPPSSPSLIFSSRQVGSALEHYRKQLGLHGIIPTPPFPVDLNAELNKPCYTWHASAHTNQRIDCTRCRLYRAVALGVMDQVRDIRNMLHACEVANEGEREVAMRRASGLNELFEAALNKECQTKPDKLRPKGVFVKDRHTLNSSAEFLKSQIKELTEMCTNDPSMKWTWGVDLTEADLARLTRGADRHKPVHPHSGYDTALDSMSLISASTHSIDPMKLEDPEILNSCFDDLSPDFPSIADLADDQHPPKLGFKMLNASGKSIDSFQPDSVYRAFGARATALWRKNKQVLQQEVDEPVAEFDSDSDPLSISEVLPNQNLIRQLSLIPCRPWLGPPPSAFIPPTSLPIVIKSSMANFSDAMDCEIPDDLYVLSPSDDGHSQDVELVESRQEMTEAAPMDIWTQERVPAIAELDQSSDLQIPDSLFILEDDNDLDASGEEQVPAPIPVQRSVYYSDQVGSALSIPRDPVSGRFTADSFTSFLDKFME